MLGMLMKCTENCNPSQLAPVTRKGPILLCNSTRLHVAQPLLQKLKGSGYAVLPHLTHSPALKLHCKLPSCVQLCATPWTIQPMKFSRSEYWSGWLFPSLWESSQPRDRNQVPRIAGRFFTNWAISEAIFTWPLANRLPLLQASQQLFAGKMFP